MEQPVNFIRTQVEVIAQKYTIRLDRELTTASEFQEELATLRIAGAGDVVHILLNGPGGSDTVMKAFLNTMAQSEAHIITEIEGQCCSALTMIFLAGHEFRVSDDSEFMIHTGSFGYGGKENNVRQFVEFNAKANTRLMHKYYKHYLTSDEIEQCIEGKDFWMDADEIMERLQKRQELFESEFAQVEGDHLNELLGDPIPENILSEMDKPTLIRLIRGELSDEEEELLEENILKEDGGEEGTSIVSETFTDEVYTLTIDADGGVDDHTGEGIFMSFSKLLDNDQSLGIKELKGYAALLGVKYAHNISESTLAKRLDEKVAEIVDSLN